MHIIRTLKGITEIDGRLTIRIHRMIKLAWTHALRFTLRFDLANDFLRPTETYGNPFAQFA